MWPRKTVRRTFGSLKNFLQNFGDLSQFWWILIKFWWYMDFKIWNLGVCLSNQLRINFEKIWKMISMQNRILRYSTVRNFDFRWFLIQFWQFCDFRVKDFKFQVLGLRISKFGFRAITNFVDFTKMFVEFDDFRNKNHQIFSKIYIWG